jgi:LAGLIDADG endonuclease
MKLLIKYLKSGILCKRTNMLAYNLTVSKFSDIENIIILLFEKHPIQGVKQLFF